MQEITHCTLEIKVFAEHWVNITHERKIVGKLSEVNPIAILVGEIITGRNFKTAKGCREIIRLLNRQINLRFQ